MPFIAALGWLAGILFFANKAKAESPYTSAFGGSTAKEAAKKLYAYVVGGGSQTAIITAYQAQMGISITGIIDAPTVQKVKELTGETLTVKR